MDWRLALPLAIGQNSAKPERGIETSTEFRNTCNSICQNSAKPERGIETVAQKAYS